MPTPPVLTPPVPPTTAAELDAFVQRFSTGDLTRDEWTHAAHLRVGAWHVHHLGPEAALPLLRERILRLNERLGTPNSSTHGYHETITAAYVRIIAVYLARFDDGAPLERRVAALLDGPLAARDLMLRFWSRDVL